MHRGSLQYALTTARAACSLRCKSNALAHLLSSSSSRWRQASTGLADASCSSSSSLSPPAGGWSSRATLQHWGSSGLILEMDLEQLSTACSAGAAAHLALSAGGLLVLSRDPAVDQFKPAC